MKPLYLSQAVRQGLGGTLRPGGETLTKKALDYLRPQKSDVVLDGGCGTGTALSLLREAGLENLFGVDLEPGLLLQAARTGCPVVQGDLADLPFADQSFDAVFCECVWNLTKKDKTLAEFQRVLRPGGSLVMSDIYLRSEAEARWPVRSCFTFATNLASVEEQVEKNGFELLLVEDHAPLLRQTAAEFVFAHGSLQKFWEAVTGDAQLATCACDAAATTKPSLFLLIARRG